MRSGVNDWHILATRLTSFVNRFKKERCSKVKKLLMMIGMATVACGANAAAITVDNVQQRWPWANNKVDITYTISGDDLDGKVAKVVLKAIVNGVTLTAYNGPVTDAQPGTFNVTWENPPAGVKRDDCKMEAYLYTLPVPEGNDYMIVNLVNGEVKYEGVFANDDVLDGVSGQALSNVHYNVDKYKSTHMVLRKIPKGTYQAKERTGAFADWTTDKDYYIGIFCWTTAQYGYVIKRSDGSDATAWGDYSLKSRRWNPSQIRGNTDPFGSVPTYASVDAAIDSHNWRPLELINAKTGMNFDIPTLLMHEIACRAGTTTTYFWGNDKNQASQYAVYGISSRTRPTNTQYADPPGTKKPNNWGLYDMVGNDWQWCRNYVDEGVPVDVFTPGSGSNAAWYVRGQNLYVTDPANLNCDALSGAPAASGAGYSFRAAYIVPNAGE